MISVRELRVDYDQFCAVRDISFEVNEGEVYGLIGPNGAGKTSAMRAIVGLLTPTYGDIRIAGIDLRENPLAVGHVLGFMPDFPPVYEDLLVWEFLDLFASSYSIPKPQRLPEIDRWLVEVGLAEKRNEFVGGLSRGMRQRLMLAKTLLPEPRVLLLDEPASGLDPHGRAQMKDIIRNFADNGGAVLVSSHILSEMDEFCTAVGIMERGEMVVDGGVDEISSSPDGSTTTLEIEFLEADLSELNDHTSLEVFEGILSRNALAGKPTRKGRKHIVAFDGGNEEAAELLQQLVTQGVAVCAFSRKRESLEDVFLQVGAKELS
ncbi:MAG: ABC transporter ATP-binding protein [Planctomycetaceae bacterium]